MGVLSWTVLVDVLVGFLVGHALIGRFAGAFCSKNQTNEIQKKRIVSEDLEDSMKSFRRTAISKLSIMLIFRMISLLEMESALGGSLSFFLVGFRSKPQLCVKI